MSHGLWKNARRNNHKRDFDEVDKFWNKARDFDAAPDTYIMYDPDGNAIEMPFDTYRRVCNNTYVQSKKKEF